MHRRLLYWLKLLLFMLLVVPAGVIIFSGGALGIAFTAPLKAQVCCETPARFGADYETVQFTTADGLTLSGWYVPPKNGAVILLVHAYYADRRQTLPVAEMLARHGYGLLLYDQRASGESDGETRSLGRLDIPDLEKAAAFVATRQKGTAIGAYGCSMGGGIALAGAAGVPSIQAVAVDAPSPLSWEEYRPAFSLNDPFSLPITAIAYTWIGLRTLTPPPVSSVQAAQNLGARPVLFISTGQGGEFAHINALFEAAVGPKEHWNIPDTSHCAAPGTHPAEYEQHLVEFFDTHLLHK
jgi:fermentation-respiration switch protein FrsA (DUF1100 family)